MGSRWTDISIINPMVKEQYGLSTQKSVKLLERIIKANPNESDTVLRSFFMDARQL